MLAFASSSLVVLPLSLLATVLATASPASAQNPIRTQFQRSLTTTVSDVNGQTFDFVIAGGGTAGLALAARLSEWSNQTVCVIEAGGTGSDVTDQINIPGYSYLNGLTGKAQDWAYKTTPQNDANNSVKSWPRGKVLGGSGSTNGMFWVRASTEEYDAWNTLNTDTGAEDWGGEQMMKYINKAEKFTMPRDDQIKTFGMVGNASVHGSSGPIQASYCAYIYDAVKNWIPAWTALGFPNIDGHSGKKRGVTITPSIINPANSSRSNSLAGYIVPNDYRPNLVILTGYQVTKVNWNSTTQGEAVAGGLAFSAGDGQTVYNVKAAREVILSGGTIGSPQLLQLSGVGPAKTLSGLGITVVSDLPVGYNVQDHISVAVGYNVASGIEVWGELIDPATAAAALTKYKAGDYDNSQWSYVNEAIGYPSMADIDSDYATYASTAAAAINDNIADMTTWQTLPANVAAGLKAQYAITNNWLSKDVGQLEIILTMLSGTSGAGIQAALQHPYSRGTILINSTNAFDYPAIDPGYFGMGYDIDILNKGVEFARKLGGTAPLSDMLLTETTPGTTVTGDALNNWIRTSSGTEYHPLGSCSMLPQASGGVVDTKLLVYGTSNLRVVDASIIPLQLSAHLMATAYGIAEKGADIIKAANAAVIKTASSSAVVASSTKAASKVSASASASATPSGGISAGVVSDATSSGMSTSTRNTVIGVVVGVAGAALVGIIAFILARRRRADQQRAAARSYYASSPEDDAWESDQHTGYAKETTAAGAAAGGGSYAMAPSHSTSDLGLPPPPTVLPAHSRSMSVASYDTAEMSGAAPMEGSTGGWYQPDMGAPYQDDHSPGMSRSPSPAAQSHLYPDSNALRPQHYHQ